MVRYRIKFGQYGVIRWEVVCKGARGRCGKKRSTGGRDLSPQPPPPEATCPPRCRAPTNKEIEGSVWGRDPRGVQDKGECLGVVQLEGASNAPPPPVTPPPPPWG